MKHKALCLPMLMLGLAVTVTGQEGKEEKIKVSELPAAVAQTLKSECPACQIDRLTREVENGVTIYDFEFKHGKGEMDVTEDGTVVSRETVVQTKDVPAAARDAIDKGAMNGRVVQILKEEVRAELSDGKITKLANPKYLYEAELAKGEEVAEIVVSTEGQVIEAPVWKKRRLKPA